MKMLYRLLPCRQTYRYHNVDSDVAELFKVDVSEIYGFCYICICQSSNPVSVVLGTLDGGLLRYLLLHTSKD